VAQLAGDEEQELAFLGQWELRDKTDGGRTTSVEERVAVLARIAELHAAMGSRMQARHYYDRVLFLAPGHETAERFLIDDAERTEDYAVVAARLEEQLVASHGEPAVALKLCQVYVQRLRTPEKARAALEQALRLYGDDEELLCALAELLDSMGQDAAAAATYQKASRGSRQHHRASLFAELACKSYLRAGLDDSVQEILSVKGLYPNTQALAEMRVELARKQGNSEEIIGALEELAVVSKDSAVARAQCLLEASEAALYQLRDLERALALAERGARMAPSHLPLQLFARMLQYRKRGVGSRQDALYTITELRSLAPSRASEAVLSDSAGWGEPAQAEVRAFLLAEALAKRSGATAGLKELREVEKSFGPLPLVDLAIGERLASSDVVSERLEGLSYLERALNGDFRHLRSRDQVALDAAVLALKLGQTERGLVLALSVDKHGEFGAAAAELVASVETSHPALVRRAPVADFAPAVGGVVPVARVALKQVPVNLVRQAIEEGPVLAPIDLRVESARPVSDSPVTGEEPDVTVANLVDMQPRSSPETARDAVSALQGETIAAGVDDNGAPTVGGLHTVAREFEETSLVKETSGLDNWLARQALTSDPFAAAKDELQRLESQPPPLASSSHMPHPGRPIPPPKPGQHKPAPAKALQAKAPPKRKPEPQQQAPSVVVSRSVVIGPDIRRPRLDPLSQPPPSAQRSLAPNSELERGLMTALTAGSVGAGRELLELLKKDGTRTRETLATCRLLAHWAPGDEQILAQLREAAQKDNDPVFARALLHVQRVLQKPDRSPAAPPLHRQSEHVDSMIKLLAGPTHAGCEALGVLWQHLPDLFRQELPELTSERRVELGGGSALGELILELGRLFGCARVAIYEMRQPGAAQFELVLAQPAALIIKGEVNPDAPHFRYELGRMLFATRPEYALIVGLDPEELHTVLGAVGVGFGPPRRLSGDVSQIAHLAERFWELLPPHVQRKLGELCEQPHVLEPEWVQEGARRALNRAGLFACADLGVAIREVARAEGVTLVEQSLKALCEQSESIADLVRFATSLEYADARWRSGTTRSSTEDLGVRAQ
jgi:tetratricopeptide (TPR) repeat protein